MTRRVTSLLEVSDPATWAAIRSAVPLDDHVLGWRSDRVCEVSPTFGTLLDPLAARGLRVMIRVPRRARPASEATALAPLELSFSTRELLHRAQRHAVGGRVLDRHAWDPEHDADLLRPLLGAGWLRRDPTEPQWYALHPALPSPPPLAFDAAEALLRAPDDLSPALPGPCRLLHDAASLAAAIGAVGPRRTTTGALGKADEKKLATHLGVTGPVETSERWGRAFRALAALGAVSTDPVTREVHLDLALEDVLEGTPGEAVQALLLRLVEPDLHPLLALVRATLRQAGDEAVDDVVFRALVREQQRDAVFWPWERDGERVYPGDAGRPFDDAGFEAVEGRLIDVLLGRLAKLGVLRVAPGVFAATDDGRVWAGVEGGPTPPVWVTGDLELLVPPDAVSPWERFQLERLGTCTARDTVDRYRLVRKNLEVWLSTHELDEALGWLRKRAPGLPTGVVDTLTAWARSATRVVWWKGVVEGDGAEVHDGDPEAAPVA